MLFGGGRKAFIEDFLKNGLEEPLEFFQWDFDLLGDASQLSPGVTRESDSQFFEHVFSDLPGDLELTFGIHGHTASL